MIMADLKIIEDLSNAFGPSGFEEEVVKVIQKHCEGLNLKNDAMHNVYAEMPGEKKNALNSWYVNDSIAAIFRYV